MLLSNQIDIKTFGIKKSVKVSKSGNNDKLEFTDETLEAIKEIKEGRGSKPYTDVDELMKDLLK